MVLKKEKKLMVNVYLSDEEKKRVEEEAGQLGISLSSYIKFCLFKEDDRK